MYVANSLNHLKIESTHKPSILPGIKQLTQCGQVTAYGVTNLAQVMACSNMAPSHYLSSFIAITPLLEITLRIDDLRHCGTHGLVKHNVCTHWGLAHKRSDDFSDRISSMLELSWTSGEHLSFSSGCYIGEKFALVAKYFTNTTTNWVRKHQFLIPYFCLLYCASTTHKRIIIYKTNFRY